MIAWERRESETEHDYLMFLRFLSMGPGRMINQVDPDNDQRRIATVAAREDWFSRVDEWDRSLTLNESELALRRQHELIEQLWLDGAKLRKLGLVILNELVEASVSAFKESVKIDSKTVRTTEKSVKDAMSMIKEGVQMQSKACGLDEEKQSAEAPPTTINIMLQEQADMQFVEVNSIKPAENVADLKRLPEPEGD